MLSPLSNKIIKLISILSLFFFIFALSACGGGSGGDDNDDMDDDANVSYIYISLSTDQEVPAVVGNAEGIGSISINTVTGEITDGSISLSFLSGDATAAHLHLAEAGHNGPAIVTLQPLAGFTDEWEFPAGTTLDSTNLAALLAGKVYVNVHTTANPSGEVRGQIIPSNYSMIRVSLNGQSEVPPVSTAATGIAYITVKNDGDRNILANVRTTGLTDATAAHIHTAFAGLNGGVALPFVQDTTDPSLWELASDSTLTQAQLDTLLAGGTYINMHSTAVASGEIRGQIIPNGVTLVRTTLDGAQEVPAFTTTGTGIGYTTIVQETGATVANVRTSDLSAAATGVHIHRGQAGTNGEIVLPLTQDATTPELWSTAEGSLLDSANQSALELGLLYFNVHTSASTSGEIRGQL